MVARGEARLAVRQRAAVGRRLLSLFAVLFAVVSLLQPAAARVDTAHAELPSYDYDGPARGGNWDGRSRPSSPLHRALLTEPASSLDVGRDYDNSSKLARAVARSGRQGLAPRTLLHGSGPARGVIEVSSGVKSTAAFRNLNPSTARNFIFDPASERFLVGEASKGSGHWGLARTIGANENLVVGGELMRGSGGRYLTNELSGHYGPNWTPAVRQRFNEFMKRFGFAVEHTPWRPRG